MFILAYPWLLVLVLVPLLLSRVLPAYRQTRAGLMVPFLGRLAHLTGQPPAPGAVVLRPPLVQQIGLWSVWLCLILALARPQWLEAPLTKTVPRRDLLLAVDLSGSMETQDFTDASGQRVDRLTAVKQVLDDFLARRKGDRVGLIFFGSAAFVQAPFTEDLEACRTLLDEAQVRMAGPQTVFGDAIGLALTVFEHTEGIQDRVLIVLTDGNDTNSKVPPVRAAEIARNKKITIYTVAVGDPTAAGEEKLDEETLKTVATTTGGRYYHANDRAALTDISTQLDVLPTRPVQTLSYRPRLDLFHWPLAAGFLLSLVYHWGWAMRNAWPRPRTASTPAPAVTASACAVVPGLEQLHFLRPWWLLALGPALLLAWAMRRHQDAARPWRDIVAPHLLPHLLTRGGPQRRLQPAYLLLIVWLLATLAVAGPTWRREAAPFAEDTSALVLAIKVTPTMLAQDIQPSRLARAVQKIHDLLAQRPGTRTALVAYAGSTHLVMPLTRDANLIEGFAAELSPKIMPVEGDVAGQALILADQQLQKLHLRGSILLITDSVAADQLPLLRAHRQNGGAPVHILAVAGAPGVPLSPDSPPAPALDRTTMQKTADTAGATLTIVSPDTSDVQRLVRHIATSIRASQPAEDGERWQDAGYWLVPILVLLTLVWFRPGWVVPWQ